MKQGGKEAEEIKESKNQWSNNGETVASLNHEIKDQSTNNTSIENEDQDKDLGTSIYLYFKDLNHNPWHLNLFYIWARDKYHYKNMV